MVLVDASQKTNLKRFKTKITRRHKPANLTANQNAIPAFPRILPYSTICTVHPIQSNELDPTRLPTETLTPHHSSPLPSETLIIPLPCPRRTTLSTGAAATRDPEIQTPPMLLSSATSSPCRLLLHLSRPWRSRGCPTGSPSSASKDASTTDGHRSGIDPSEQRRCCSNLASAMGSNDQPAPRRLPPRCTCEHPYLPLCFPPTQISSLTLISRWVSGQ
jgi:hypothetical protein